MNKYTTEQLKASLITLRDMPGADAQAAYEMTFDEVARRMGDEAFDEWCEALGW
ncbi:MAG: hypothetical protein ACRDC7_18155 [Aeromonas veronii]